MGQPVVHFEIMGGDADQQHRYYSELFGWEIDANNPMNYGTIAREGNTDDDGAGIGGGVTGDMAEGYAGHVTIYVKVPDVGAALEKAEELGGKKEMDAMEVPGAGIIIGQFYDPAGHLIGVIQPT